MSLNALLLDGNPLKSIRRAVLEQPAPKLLEYLRTRIDGMFLFSSSTLSFIPSFEFTVPPSSPAQPSRADGGVDSEKQKMFERMVAEAVRDTRFTREAKFSNLNLGVVPLVTY